MDATYPPHANAPGYSQERTSGKAVASLVMGIVGLFIGNIILGPLAIIFGAIAQSDIKKSGGQLKGNGMATAGLVLGILAVVLFVLILILMGSLMPYGEF